MARRAFALPMDKEKLLFQLQATHHHSGLTELRRQLNRGDYLGEAAELVRDYLAEQEQAQQLAKQAPRTPQANASRPAPAMPKICKKAKSTHLPAHKAKNGSCSSQKTAHQARNMATLALLIAAAALGLSLYQALQAP